MLDYGKIYDEIHSLPTRDLLKIIVCSHGLQYSKCVHKPAFLADLVYNTAISLTSDMEDIQLCAKGDHRLQKTKNLLGVNAYLGSGDCTQVNTDIMFLKETDSGTGFLSAMEDDCGKDADTVFVRLNPGSQYARAVAGDRNRAMGRELR